MVLVSCLSAVHCIRPHPHAAFRSRPEHGYHFTETSAVPLSQGLWQKEATQQQTKLLEAAVAPGSQQLNHTLRRPRVGGRSSGWHGTKRQRSGSQSRALASQEAPERLRKRNCREVHSLTGTGRDRCVISS